MAFIIALRVGLRVGLSGCCSGEFGMVGFYYFYGLISSDFCYRKVSYGGELSYLALNLN